MLLTGNFSLTIFLEAKKRTEDLPTDFTYGNVKLQKIYVFHTQKDCFPQTFLFLKSSQKVKCINDQKGKIIEYWVKKKMALLEIQHGVQLLTQLINSNGQPVFQSPFQWPKTHFLMRFSNYISEQLCYKSISPSSYMLDLLYAFCNHKFFLHMTLKKPQTVP